MGKIEKKEKKITICFVGWDFVLLGICFVLLLD